MKKFTSKMLQKHVKSGETYPRIGRIPAPAIICADGFTVSVQASDFHYCTPRDNKGPYVTFELGFPSSKEESLMPYVEDADNPTGTVYAQVPEKVVLDLINVHGGLKE